jgi:hypothetical protein
MNKLAIAAPHPIRRQADVEPSAHGAVKHSSPRRNSGRPHSGAARVGVARVCETGLPIPIHEARCLHEAEPRVGGAARRPV